MTRKPTAYILLLVTACALLAGCGRSVSDADRLLARIDSLADVDPDSADVLLKSTPSPSMKGWEKDEVALLLRIKVDDKLYRPVTHYRDTTLQLVSYFEQHPKVLPSVLGSTGPALPYLYAGRIFADLGDAPQALDYYQRALDAQSAGQMENGKWKIENENARRLAKQRGLLHSLIGTIFVYQNLHYEAITSMQEANRSALQSKDTLDIIFNYRDIAGQYKFLENNDSSLSYYEKALYLAQESHNSNMCNDISLQIADLYNKMKDYSKAHHFVQASLCDIDSANISATYCIAADIYLNLGQKDSAYVFLQNLLKYGNVFGKQYAYRELSNIAIQRNDLLASKTYFRQYKLLDDSIRKMENAETVARMHAAYNYQKHEREAQQLKAKNDRMRVYLLLLSSAMVVMLLLAGLVVLRRRYKRQLVQSSMGKTDLLRYSYEQKTEQQKLSEREQVTGSTIYAAIQSHLGKAGDVPLSDDEWQQLHQTVNAVYPNFREKLTSLTPMNNFEYQVCLLLKIGVKPSEIASLTTHSRESVTSSRRRLYEKAMKKSGKPSDWDALVTIL